MANGDSANAETIGESTPQPSTSTSKWPVETAKVTDYLVGSALDEALAAGQDIDVYWPFAEGEVNDWTQAEALWYVYAFDHSPRRLTSP